MGEKKEGTVRRRWNESNSNNNNNNASLQAQEYLKINIWTLNSLYFPWPVAQQRGYYIKRKWNKVSFLVLYAFQLETTHVDVILFRG